MLRADPEMQDALRNSHLAFPAEPSPGLDAEATAPPDLPVPPGRRREVNRWQVRKARRSVDADLRWS
jgi:hypothetical protein